MKKPTDLADIPSGMDNDPAADEQIIKQEEGEHTPAGHVSTDPDELANSIALAIDGSGTGLPGSTPVVGDAGKVTTEGATGASLDEEF